MVNYRFGGYNNSNATPVISAGTATISGQVLGTNGYPAANYPMSAAVNGQMRPQSGTDSSGRYSVTVTIGSTVTVAPVTQAGITSEPPRYTFSRIQANAPGSNFQLKRT